MADYLVTLRDVVVLVANNELRTMRTFVATIRSRTDREIEFDTKRVFMLEKLEKKSTKITDGAKMAVPVVVPLENLAGMLELPPENKEK